MSGETELMPIDQAKLDEGMNNKEYTDFIIAKVKDGRLHVINTTTIDEMNQKAVAGADMKQPLKFDGKQFITNNFQVLQDGSLILNVQDKKKNLYKGVYLMHFSPEGKLIRNYSVQLDQKNKKGFFNNSPLTADEFPSVSFVSESKDGKSVMWMMEMVKAIDKDIDSDTSYNWFAGTKTTTTTATYSPFYSIEYGKLNLQNGTSSEFNTLGDFEKKKFYLYEKYNRIQLGDNVYFFSETPNGDKLLVSRLNISH